MNIQRTLQGLATIWTDYQGLPGPKSSNFAMTLTIDQSGKVTTDLSPINLDNSHTLKPNGNGSGHYDFSSGSLELSIPVLVDKVPVFGKLDTTLHLSTSLTVTPPHQGPFSGTPVGSPTGATGSITLAGTASVTVFIFVTYHACIRVAGTLSE